MRVSLDKDVDLPPSVSLWQTFCLGEPMTDGSRHLLLVIPPILALGFLYSPVLGRRDVFKMIWACSLVCLFPFPPSIMSQLGFFAV